VTRSQTFLDTIIFVSEARPDMINQNCSVVVLHLIYNVPSECPFFAISMNIQGTLKKNLSSGTRGSKKKKTYVPDLRTGQAQQHVP
jgi:hypothetical protein